MDDVPVSRVTSAPVLTVSSDDRLDAAAGAMLEMEAESDVVELDLGTN